MGAFSPAGVQAGKLGVIFEFVVMLVKVLFDADLDMFPGALIANFQGGCNFLQFRFLLLLKAAGKCDDRHGGKRINKDSHVSCAC